MFAPSRYPFEIVAAAKFFPVLRPEVPPPSLRMPLPPESGNEFLANGSGMAANDSRGMGNDSARRADSVTLASSARILRQGVEARPAAVEVRQDESPGTGER